MKNENRKIGLSIIIVLLIGANLAGVFKLYGQAGQLSQIYTFLSAEQVKWLTIIPVASIISLVAIWFGKRWGIVMAVIAFVVVLFLDLYYKVWAHAIIAMSGFTLLIFFCLQSRQYFTFHKEKDIT